MNIHQCDRCEDYKIILPATILLVGGCAEKMHVEERWLCDRHYELLRKGTLDNNRMPYCRTCYRQEGDGRVRRGYWADYLARVL